MSEVTMRRLPVYLVLDVSGSMMGEPLEAVQMGCRALLADLKGDPQALETAFISAITFGSDARQIMPLTELAACEMPRLESNGSTALGDGLRCVVECVEREVRKQTEKVKGDWKPLVFLMTDGQPTDEWREAANVLRLKRWNVIACAAGPCADVTVLKQITENVLVLRDLAPDTMKAFFRWVSASVKVTSASIGAGGKPTAAPALPNCITIVP